MRYVFVYPISLLWAFVVYAAIFRFMDYTLIRDEWWGLPLGIVGLFGVLGPIGFLGEILILHLLKIL